MNDLISREALLDGIRTSVEPFTVAMVFRRIHNAPIVDAVPVRRGRWIGWHGDKLVGIDDSGGDLYRHYHYNTCCFCGKGSAVKRNFCPNCGADMREEQK